MEKAPKPTIYEKFEQEINELRNFHGLEYAKRAFRVASTIELLKDPNHSEVDRLLVGLIFLIEAESISLLGTKGQGSSDVESQMTEAMTIELSRALRERAAQMRQTVLKWRE